METIAKHKKLVRACGVPAVVLWAVSFGRSTAGNDVVGTILISLFFSYVFFLHFLSPLLPFLTEGVLGSKNS